MYGKVWSKNMTKEHLTQKQNPNGRNENLW
jgi:hypothetical protein